jgi:MFS family permease
MSTATLLSGFLGIGAGRLSDRFGPKKIVLICNLFFGLGIFLMSRIHAIWQLYLFYGIISAIGFSSAISPMQSTVIRWFIKKRGLMVSIFLMGLTGGSLFMPPIAEWLITLYGWRDAYMIIALADFSVVTLAAILLKRDPAEMGLQPYGSGDIRENTLNNHHMEDLTLKEAIRTSQFWLLCCYFFCIAFAMLTIMTHIVPHAIDVGLSSALAAIVLSAIGGTATAALIPVGTLVDKIGVKNVAIALTSLLAISLLFVSLVGNAMWSLFVFAIIFGIAFSSLDILLSMLSSNLFGLASLGAIIGFVNAILQFGGASGPFIAGIIFDASGSYRDAFLVCTCLCIIALVVIILLRTRYPRNM